MPMRKLEESIYDTFASVAASLGYSPLHGKIIAALYVNHNALTLQELAKATGYSASMISLSLELLEVLNIIKKVKKTADRKLYVELQDDLLGALKKAITFRVQKNIKLSLGQFEESRTELNKLEGTERDRILRALGMLEKELKRLERYVQLLDKIHLP